MRTWIKICGATCIDDALASVEAGADALGFVFAPSPRRVSAEQALAIVASLPSQIERIGVFRNETVSRVLEIAQQVGLTAVQLHGEETPAFIAELMANSAESKPLGIIKTVLVDSDFAGRFPAVCRDYHQVDSILLDSGGGSGRTFDWQKCEPLLSRNNKRLIVAGGLSPGNVGEALKTFSPWGVDVVSGVEREPGRKDPDKLKAFVAAVRRAEKS
jgi:phosphoribosylanthranilate isomerase